MMAGNGKTMETDFQELVTRLETEYTPSRVGKPKNSTELDLLLVVKMVKMLNGKLGEAKKEITTLTKDIEGMKLKLTEKDKEISELKSLESQSGTSGSKSWSEVVLGNSKGTHMIVNEVVANLNERKSRENNVIVFGLNESTTTKTLLDHLQIEENKIRNTHKLIPRGITNENKHPILLEFNNVKDRNEMLKKARCLRDEPKESSLAKIYVNPDLTLAERMMQKQLRDDRNEKNKELEDRRKADTDNQGDYSFYYAIRRGKVVKIPKEKSKSKPESDENKDIEKEDDDEQNQNNQ